MFDGNIRKRPLAVVNEGSRNAFITCSFPMKGSGATRVDMWVSITTGVWAPIICNGVTGYPHVSSS